MLEEPTEKLIEQSVNQRALLKAKIEDFKFKSRILNLIYKSTKT